MTTLLSGASVRQIALGQYVDRATATLPQTASGNIFTVTGGAVILTSLVGRVTTAIGGTATNLKVTYTPTVGSASDIAANVAVTSKPVGTALTLPGTLGSALVAGATGAYGPVAAPGLLILPAGTMSITTDASTTGSVRWTLTYVPFDAGAAVAAA